MAYFEGAGDIFPLPNIGAQVPLRADTRSRRVVARHRRTERISHSANFAIDALNELSFSFYNSAVSSPVPDLFVSPSPSSDVGPAPPSAIQARLMDHVFQSAKRFDDCRHRASAPSSGDPSTPSSCPDTAAWYSGSVDSRIFNGYFKGAPAMPIISDRISLPDIGAAIDVLDVLPSNLKSYYASAASCMRVASSPPADTGGVEIEPSIDSHVRARLIGSHYEYVKLIGRMVKCGMVRFTDKKPLVVNGLFAVKKDAERDRLIIDARPANIAFADSPRVNLPSPEWLAQLHVPSHEETQRAPRTRPPLYVAKCDLSDFFYRFRTPEWMWPYFGLPPVTSDEVGLTDRFVPGTRVWPLFVAVAMGWSHAVFVTQAIHEAFLDYHTPFIRADRITDSSDRRLDRVRHMVYIDDLIIIGFNRDVMTAMQRRYVDAANARGMPVKPSKVALPSATGVDCLGLCVNGTDYSIGLRVDKLHTLCVDTRQMMVDGRCTGRELAALVGRWTWASLIRRPLLSVFNACYKFIIRADRQRWCLWQSVRRELWTAIRLAPLLYDTISTPWFHSVVACDASLAGFGMCATRTSATTMNMATQCENNNESDTHLDLEAPSHVQFINRIGSDVAIESSIESSTSPSSEPSRHALPPNLMESFHDWRTIISSPWRGAEEHINLFELRAVTTSLRWVLSFPSSVDRRLLLLCDSQVAVGALMKGRSSSQPILRRLRHIAALLLASGLRVCARWIASHLNPADEPSRHF